MQVLLKYRKDLVLKYGLLYRRANLKGHDQAVNQFVLPASFCKRSVLARPDDFGHLGVEQTLALLQDWFF